jgi:hypothetical protein
MSNDEMDVHPVDNHVGNCSIALLRGDRGTTDTANVWHTVSLQDMSA